MHKTDKLMRTDSHQELLALWCSAGRISIKEVMYVCIWLIYLAVQQKLTELYKVAILKKNKYLKSVAKFLARKDILLAFLTGSI